MINLTQAQMCPWAQSDVEPLRALTPQTQELFVRARNTHLERLGDEVCDTSPWTDEERDQLGLEACQMLDSFGTHF